MNNFDILYFCIEYAGLRYFFSSIFVVFRRFSSIFVPIGTKIDEKLTPEVAFWLLISAQLTRANVHATEICLRLQERHRA